MLHFLVDIQLFFIFLSLKSFFWHTFLIFPQFAIRWKFFCDPSLFLTNFLLVNQPQISSFQTRIAITFDVVAVDYFWEHTWNQRIMLVKVLENEENRRTTFITIHPPTRPPNRTIKVFEIWKRPIIACVLESPILVSQSYLFLTKSNFQLFFLKFPNSAPKLPT